MAEVDVDLGTMEVVTAPVVQMREGAPGVVVPADMSKISGEWGNLQSDLAVIQSELDNQEPKVEEPKTPVQADNTKSAPQGQMTQEPQKIPEKFLNADGTLDQDRLLQSYREAERALKRAQQKVNAATPGAYQVPAEPTSQPQPAVAGSFEAEIEADLQKLGPGKTLAKLFEAAKMAAYAQSRSDIESFHERIEDQSRMAELKAIGERDPWVFTQQGFDTLKIARESNPWISQSPEPWKTAYLLVKGQSAIGKNPNGQVLMPTPKAAVAPSGPTGAVPRISPQSVRLDSKEQVGEYLKTLTPAQEKQFWAKFGLRY